MTVFAFVEMPAAGHVNPSLPIARELVRRGERVVYYTDAEFQSAVERTGATFHPYPTGVLTSRMIAEATQTGDLTRVPTVILRATESLLPFMLDELPSSTAGGGGARLERRLGPRSGEAVAPAASIADDDTHAQLQCLHAAAPARVAAHAPTGAAKHSAGVGGSVARAATVRQVGVSAARVSSPRRSEYCVAAA